MNQDELVFKALRDRGGIEPAKVTHYHAYRDGKSEITVEVHDHGDGDSARFMVYVRDAEGNLATGNPQKTLRDALELLHWRDVGMVP